MQFIGRLAHSRTFTRITIPRVYHGHALINVSLTYAHSHYSTPVKKDTKKKKKKKSSAPSPETDNLHENHTTTTTPLAFSEDQVNLVQENLENYVHSIRFWEDVNLLKKFSYSKGATEQETQHVRDMIRAFGKLLFMRKQNGQWGDRQQRDMVIRLYVPLMERLSQLLDCTAADIEEEMKFIPPMGSYDDMLHRQMEMSNQYFQESFDNRQKLRVILDQTIESDGAENAERLRMLKRDMLGRMGFHMLRIGKPKECAEMLESVLTMYGMSDPETLEEIERKVTGMDEEDIRRITFTYSNGAICYLIGENAFIAEHYFNAAVMLATKWNLTDQLALLDKTRPQIFAGIRSQYSHSNNKDE